MSRRRRWARLAARGVGIACLAVLVALAASPTLRERARWWVQVARIAARVNMDESRVPEYVLPDPLVGSDGRRIDSACEWLATGRRDILATFRREIYGEAPPATTQHVRVASSETALGGRAVRRQVSIGLAREPGAPRLELLLYLPADASGPTPVFLGLNFWGNHSIHPDPGIALSERWLPDAPERGIEAHRAMPAARGASRSRWPVEQILARGYGLATAYYGDLEPDRRDGANESVRAHVPFGAAPDPARWGALAAWAWGLSRALDHLLTDAGVDARRVIAIGHSRLGKAALWAAAQDERFAGAISNDSGCMGAALSRRRFGETIAFVNRLFPHWFPERFDRYSGAEDELPVDQHMLLALLAPRPLYVASAAEDQWADPTGEFLAAHAASPVFRLLGGAGLATDAMPAIGDPVLSQVGYHVRAGEHDLTAEDWAHFLDFADRQLPAAAEERVRLGAACEDG